MWFWRLQLVLQEKKINKGFLSSHQLANSDYAVMPSLVFGAGLIWMASLICFLCTRSPGEGIDPLPVDLKHSRAWTALPRCGMSSEICSPSPFSRILATCLANAVLSTAS